jgi:hypothetical protein
VVTVITEVMYVGMQVEVVRVERIGVLGLPDSYGAGQTEGAGPEDLPDSMEVLAGGLRVVLTGQ